MILRPYQKEAENKTFDSWSEGASSVLLDIATGLGKTVIASSVIRRMFPRRTMFLAHRQELIWQAVDKIKRITGLRVDVEMGEYKADIEKNWFTPRTPVIVSTVQTHTAGGDGGGRIGKFNPKDFGLLIIDEAHHACAASYRRIIDYYKTNPNLKILGITATPDRTDEEALGQIFDEVAYEYEVLDGIQHGWLVPVDQQLVSITSLDFSRVRTTAGDLNGADLDAVMKAEKNLHGVASATIDIIGDRRGIGFASSVEHAKTLANIFNRHRQGMADWVCGKTDKDERKKIVADFAQGKIQWLWNCGVFTEGFDDAGVEVISMGRPTKSRALYAQMIGRATRPDESIAHKLSEIGNDVLRRGTIARSKKPSCLIIDFVGNSGKHKLITTGDILGGNVSEEARQATISLGLQTKRAVRVDKTLEEQEALAEARRTKEREELARKGKVVGKAEFKLKSVDPFDILQIKPVQPRGWDRGKELTEKQRAILRKAGFNPDEMEYGRAKQLIGIMLDRWANKKCTIGQAKILKKYGCDTEMSFELASKTIDAIAKNGWKKPKELPNEDTVSGAIGDPDIPF